MCANGWANPGYPEWGKSRDDDEPNAPVAIRPTRIVDPDGAGFTILKANPATRMVSIAAGPSGTGLWVNAEALQCEPRRNIGAYAALPFGASGGAGSCPFVPKLPVDPTAINQLNTDAQSELGRKIVDKALDYQRQLHESVDNDMKTLTTAFNAVPSVDEQYEVLRKAYDRVEELYARASKIYGADCRKADFSQETWEIPRERGQRTCRSLRYAHNVLSTYFPDKPHAQTIEEFRSRAIVAHYKEGEELQDTFKDSTAFGKMMFDENPTNNQLFVRTAIYYGMGLDKKTGLSPDQCRVKGSLKLVNRDTPDFNSMEQSLGLRRPASPGDDGHYDEIHNGYLYGATGKPGDPIECAGFALNYILGMKRQPPADSGMGTTPSVWDFDNLHKSLSGEGGPAPMVDQYAGCFQVVDLRKGQVPAPGDFVSSHGHVAIIEKFDPDKREVSTIEAASGTCGSVCHTQRPLYESACVGTANDASANDWSLRPLRSDLRILRYAPREGSRCPIRMSAPSSPRPTNPTNANQSC